MMVTLHATPLFLGVGYHGPRRVVAKSWRRERIGLQPEHPATVRRTTKKAVQRNNAGRTRSVGAGREQNSESSMQSFAEDALGVVITGGTKGVGYAFARDFLAKGDRVLICGRDPGRTAAALDALKAEFGANAQVFSAVCDVSSPTQVEALAKTAKAKLGIVHHWINNAGMASRTRVNLIDMDPEEIVEVSGTNVTGSLLCCREAVRLMISQPQTPLPSYHVYNCGFSSWGASFSSSTAPHKATKRALAQLTQSLSEELQKAGITWIGIHQLSPGMVLTDLLLEESTPGARRFFNVMAEEPETVAAALVPQMRRMQGTGGAVEFLTPLDALRRVVTGVPSIINGGRFFDKDGNRVQIPGNEYQDNGVRMPYRF